MSLPHVDGKRFQKMVLRATGSTSQMKADVQKTLRETGAARYMRPGAKVTRRQATKVLHALKDAGLAPKAVKGASTFVSGEFAKEKQRQENIKRQNVEDRKNEIEAEKQAELAAKAGKKPANKDVGRYNTPLQNSAMPMHDSAPDTQKERIAAQLRKMKQQSQAVGAGEMPDNAGPQEWPEEWKKADDDLIDLAID